MQDKSTVHPDATGSDENGKATNGKKMPYTPPVLHTYGSVGMVTQGSGGTSPDVSSSTSSDRSLKENLARVGTHPLGVGLYLFDYKPEYREVAGFGRHFGVMADEVEAVLPQAVGIHPLGHKVVNYAMLGIKLPVACIH